ncbi:MAG: proline--tRNA ligase [Chlamydiae bacterium]|nr:proline--tRNA ligase [Chlamydiota bacterium]
MSQQKKTAIVPTREENYAEWYQEVIKGADLAEHSPVRGCMVIKPWGYELWEQIKTFLDKRFKETGHQNAYFPLFIPLSFLEKEAEHVEGFAKECAVVTHHRLEKNAQGRLVPSGELEEPLIVRPTSETIIGEMFSKWIASYRDLPVLINQWANVVRWEMRTRLFLRTAEFLWQEGHTAHATKEEALEETRRMLEVYAEVIEKHLAIPVIRGEKTARERFPGAVNTLTLEAMMQDGKALQLCTSHFLGQNFAKASKIQFSSKEGQLEYAWTTSWGSTTRLIGALVMTHSDDDGLILPPHVASAHVVILPIVHKEETKEKVYGYCQTLKEELEKISYLGAPLKVVFDQKDLRIGDKMWGWVKKGIPLRIEVGPKEIDEGVVSVFRRIDAPKQSKKMTPEQLKQTLYTELETMQEELFQKAKARRDRHIVSINTKEEFYNYFSGESSQGGFAMVHYNAEHSVEDKIQQELNVTVRCIPFGSGQEEGECPFTKKKSQQRVLYAKSY